MIIVLRKERNYLYHDEFGEQRYKDAQMLAAWKNDKHNGVRPSNKPKVEDEKKDKPKSKKSKAKKIVVEKEYIKRYEVRAKEAEP